MHRFLQKKKASPSWRCNISGRKFQKRAMLPAENHISALHGWKNLSIPGRDPKDPGLGERVVRYVFDNVGNAFPAASITKYLKSKQRTLDNETVYNYLSKPESAYILHRCSRYDIKSKELLKALEKFYPADPALRYSVLGYNADSAPSMLEIIVYLTPYCSKSEEIAT